MPLRSRRLEQQLPAPLEYRERPGHGQQGKHENGNEEAAGAHGGALATSLEAATPRRYRASGPLAGPETTKDPMSVNADQVRHVAKLARIAVSDAEVEAMVPEFNNILGWVEQLAEVDTDGVESLTAVIANELRLRDDVVNDGDCRDEILKNAPDAQHGFFAVPKVIE